MDINLLIKIFFTPWIGWKELKEISIPFSSSFYRILLPIVLTASIISYIGVFMHQSGNHELALKYLGFTFLKWILTINISSWAVNKLIGGFKGTKDLNISFLVIIISSSFLVLCSSFTHIFPTSKVLFAIISSLGIIHLYFGMVLLITIPRERIAGFLLISLLIFALNIFLFEVILGLVFNFPIQL